MVTSTAGNRSARIRCLLRGTAVKIRLTVSTHLAHDRRTHRPQTLLFAAIVVLFSQHVHLWHHYPRLSCQQTFSWQQLVVNTLRHTHEICIQWEKSNIPTYCTWSGGVRLQLLCRTDVHTHLTLVCQCVTGSWCKTLKINQQMHLLIFLNTTTNIN